MVKTHPPQMPEAPKLKKPDIKSVLDSCLWDSGRWDGWEIILGLIPPFFRDIWSYKTSETSIFTISWIFDVLDACLMVHGSWLKAHGSWPRGAGPAPEPRGAAPVRPGPAAPLGSGVGPAPLGHEP